MEGREKVAVVKCLSYEKVAVDKAVKQALRLIDFKFKKGVSVLIKPNALSPHKPEEGITTHPAVIEAVCKILKQHKCRIFIGDSSSYETSRSLEVSGIKGIAEKYGKLVNFDASEKIRIHDSSAILFKEFYLPKILKDVDLVINMPKLKTHDLTKLTLAVKNLFGCIPGYKMKYHKLFPTEEDFSDVLVDIYQNIKPQLNILDGIVGMEGAGPAAGKLKKTNLIIASRNAVALDWVTAGIVGFSPEEILTNLKASQRGLKNFKIQVKGIKPRIDFEKPSLITGKTASLYALISKHLPERKPALNKNKCTKCALCARYCPVKAISMQPYPRFDRKECISCFCCSEICPEHAILQKQNMITRLFSIAAGVYKKLKKF